MNKDLNTDLIINDEDEDLIEVIPEEIIYKYLENKRNRKNILPVSYLKYLPQKIDISEEFVINIKKYIQYKVMTGVSQFVQFKRFNFIENENTIQIDLTDKKFWKNINFNFSENLINTIWKDIINPKIDNNINLTDWDIIFLNLEGITTNHDYLDIKKLSIDCDFLAMYYFFENIKTHKINEKFPLEKYYLNYENTNYTKKFLLIDKTAKYYKEASKVINDMTEHIIMNQGDSTFSYNNVDLYNHRDPLKVFEIFSENLFSFEIVKKACNYWLNTNNESYDEYTYINAKINETNLNESIDQLKKDVAQLRALKINV